MLLIAPLAACIAAAVQALTFAARGPPITRLLQLRQLYLSLISVVLIGRAMHWSLHSRRQVRRQFLDSIYGPGARLIEFEAPNAFASPLFID